MVFRLPTHLEAFIPPPSDQVPQSRRPWQGSLILPASGGPSQSHAVDKELRVTAVETDGDKCVSSMLFLHARHSAVDLWPARFFVHMTHGRTPLRDMQAWVRRHKPPLCTFLPDRLRDPAETATNQAQFRSLSRMLFENQMVAIAPWSSPERLPGAGIIIYPAQNTTAILVGALFLSSSFPDFMSFSPHHTAGPAYQTSPTTILPPPQQSHRYQQPPPSGMPPPPSSSSYGISRHGYNLPQIQPPPSLPPVSHRYGQYPSPIEQHGQSSHTHGDKPPEQYRYPAITPSRTIPGYPTPSSSSSTDPSWPIVKDEDDGDLSEFTTSLRGGHGHGHSSQYPPQ
ncbi:hypothetical protein PLICRDRAFT_118121 [Plicaturopsis crispa FD-325 SS-3]|uniref:Uncharacterized protein n=1 Tax=Plicaturopsis crispa FD-325 SS-3 TaxID=944288 RepID=A0A0C9SKS5_PLICR|nr:hypothetical protein PLICRDRAFT_118121 [Plicaturopsis crispa FD-325 SS-3]